MMGPGIQAYPVAVIFLQLLAASISTILQRTYARHALKNNPAATKHDDKGISFKEALKPVAMVSQSGDCSIK